MDQYEKPAETKLKAVGKYQFLKSTLQIVISVAFLSIFLSHSSSFAYSLFPHSFNVYFSTFLFSLFTHTLERKYMFLFCNGILAFIAKSSVSGWSTILANSTDTKASVIDGGVPLAVEVPGEEPEDAYGDEVEKGSLGGRGGEEENEASVTVEDDVNGGEEDEEREKR
ncbi:uncharacterized protein LOC120217337 [Hibiscus syriacus]|uniref:uncharacterized protein LOC120217337 n=1 Tax=Hibiscus syriacus TaxID=106335 RepID=UPI0019226E6D|nr:uncharacterized protein LOC120217337 [Hibiscus syriacus]